MAEKNRKTYSVPSSPVDCSIKSFLETTPIPTLKKKEKLKSPQFIKGVPTPIKKGQLTPNSEAISLLSGFATGQVRMEGEEVLHLPSISESLHTLWETPKKSK